MWICEWIWQTYCCVMMTSIALGLVTTILCSWCVCSPSPFSQEVRPRERRGSKRTRIREAFMEFLASLRRTGLATPGGGSTPRVGVSAFEDQSDEGTQRKVSLD